MIAPQELRLGNYFQVPTMPYLGLQKVQAITGKYISGIDFNLVEAIELTEDWLLKFGFTKVKSDYEEAETYDFYFGNIYFDMANQSTKIHGHYCLSFVPEFVHQLQNLFFALTGEELKIKEL